jgi:hypothetical protein
MPVDTRSPVPPLSFAALRRHHWSAPERAALISVIAIAMAALFVTTYSLALGNPIPHGIPIAVVGDPAAHVAPVQAIAQVAGGPNFRAYDALPAALDAVDWQQVYAALDLTAARPTLYVASAAGASVARALERVSAVDPDVRIVDTHPLGANDPNGLDIFYLMLATTILGLITPFQVRGNAHPLSLRQWSIFVLALALSGSLVLTLVVGPLLQRLALPVAESWAILTLQLLAVASFASLMAVLIGPWAILPTWLFFVILGNSSSGGAVAPPLLPAPFAFVSQWLPSGATVTALRNAVYFPDHQYLRPIAVLATWAIGIFVVMVAVSWRRHTSPGTP